MTPEEQYNYVTNYTQHDPEWAKNVFALRERAKHIAEHTGPGPTQWAIGPTSVFTPENASMPMAAMTYTVGITLEPWLSFEERILVAEAWLISLEEAHGA